MIHAIWMIVVGVVGVTAWWMGRTRGYLENADDVRRLTTALDESVDQVEKLQRVDAQKDKRE